MYPNQDTKFVNVVAPTVRINNASFSILNTRIDTLGFHSIMYIVQLGATDIAMTALNVTECDTTGGSYTLIPLSDYSVSPLTLPAAGDGNKLFAIRIPVNGLRKRYQEPVFTAGNGSLGTYLSCIAILGNPDNAPYDATTQGLAQLAIVAG